MTNVKFTGPADKIKLNFRKLPTPMVEWEGTAKELHDHLMTAWVNSEPELAGAAPDVEKLARVIYERAFDCKWDECTGAERALWLEVAEAVRRSLQPQAGTDPSK